MTIAQGLLLAFATVVTGLVVTARGSAMLQGGGLQTAVGVPLTICGGAITSTGIAISWATWIHMMVSNLQA